MVFLKVLFEIVDLKKRNSRRQKQEKFAGKAKGYSIASWLFVTRHRLERENTHVLKGWVSLASPGVRRLLGTRLIWITWRLTRWAHYRRTSILPNFNQGVEAARPVSPLTVSKVITVAPFLPDCSGLLPLIGVSQRRRRGSGVRRFGAKETQP